MSTHSFAILPAALAALLLSDVALAQGSGRFPDPPGTSNPTPPPPPPVAPVPQPAPPVGPPTPPVAPPVEPAPSGVSTRGPTYQGYGPYDPGYAPAPQPAPGSFLPELLPYRPGMTVPPGYEVETHANRGLAIGGSLLFIGSYVAAIGAAGASGFDNGTGWLALPVAGPWATIASRSSPCEDDQEPRECVNDALDEGVVLSVLVLDGLAQLTGFSLMIIGAASKTHWLVRKDAATSGPEVSFAPRVGSGGGGFSLYGRF